MKQKQHYRTEVIILVFVCFVLMFFLFFLLYVTGLFKQFPEVDLTVCCCFFYPTIFYFFYVVLDVNLPKGIYTHANHYFLFCHQPAV